MIPLIYKSEVIVQNVSDGTFILLILTLNISTTTVDSWNIPTTTEDSWNIPTAYITLSCQSEFIVQNGPIGILSTKIQTEATWNILNTTEASLNIPNAYIELSC